ncbi:type IV secretion system protein [Lysobacter sp. CA199]|uniref:type IV secretion system protein n=1 Tax=Lysobacter sp. CA199 TaxID=3455608 RepID=UPI003F8D171C
MDLQLFDGPLAFIAAKAAGVLDFAFYKLISESLTEEIDEFGFALMRRMMKLVAAVGVSVGTLYFMIMGYRIVTGQSREPMMALVVDSLKVVLCLAIASGATLFNGDLYSGLTNGLDMTIHETVTGIKGHTSADSVDQHLGYMQIALSSIDAVQVVDGDVETREQKTRALFFAGFGTASVPMTVGALMLMYRSIMAFWVGLAPLFILFLIFPQTKELFKKWLLAGIATYFAMAALSAMSAIAFKLLTKVAVAFWVSKAVTGISGLDAEGMSTLAIQQGGLGLILTAVLITVPQAVGMFFHGALGSFTHFSAFGGGAASQPGPQGQPPGSHSPPPTNRSEPRTNQTAAPGDSYNSGTRYTPGPSAGTDNNNEIKKK